MRRFVVLTVLPLMLLGCAAEGSGADPAASADRSDDTLHATLERWDAAAAAADADELLVASRVLPWHVVRECGPTLEAADRTAIFEDGDAALAALADAEDEQDAPLSAATITELLTPYVEDIRRLCA